MDAFIKFMLFVSHVMVLAVFILINFYSFNIIKNRNQPDVLRKQSLKSVLKTSIIFTIGTIACFGFGVFFLFKKPLEIVFGIKAPPVYGWCVGILGISLAFHFLTLFILSVQKYLKDNKKY